MWIYGVVLHTDKEEDKNKTSTMHLFNADTLEEISVCVFFFFLNQHHALAECRDLGDLGVCVRVFVYVCVCVCVCIHTHTHTYLLT